MAEAEVAGEALLEVVEDDDAGGVDVVEDELAVLVAGPSDVAVAELLGVVDGVAGGEGVVEEVLEAIGVGRLEDEVGAVGVARGRGR